MLFTSEFFQIPFQNMSVIYYIDLTRVSVWTWLSTNYIRVLKPLFRPVEWLANENEEPSEEIELSSEVSLV